MQPVGYGDGYAYGPAAKVPSHLLAGATRTSWPPALAALTLAEPPPQHLQQLSQLQQQQQQSFGASMFGAVAATSLFDLDLHALPPSLRWLRIHHSHVLLSSASVLPLPADILPHLSLLEVAGVPERDPVNAAAAAGKFHSAQYPAGWMRGLQPSAPSVSMATFEGNDACLAELTRRVDATRQAKLKREQQMAVAQARQEEYQRDQQKRAAAHAFVQGAGCREGGGAGSHQAVGSCRAVGCCGCSSPAFCACYARRSTVFVAVRCIRIDVRCRADRRPKETGKVKDRGKGRGDENREERERERGAIVVGPHRSC